VQAHVIILPWTHPSLCPKRHLDRLSRFLHNSRQRVHVLYKFALFRLRNCPFHGRSRPPSNTRFFGPPKSTNQTSAPSVQRFSDRLTDHATQSETVGCIHVRSTAMRPQKCTCYVTSARDCSCHVTDIKLEAQLSQRNRATLCVISELHCVNCTRYMAIDNDNLWNSRLRLRP